MSRPKCASINRDGQRCTRRPEPEHFLCTFHQKVESPAQSEAIVRHFLRDLVAMGKQIEPDLLLQLMWLGFQDDDLREKFLAGLDQFIDERRPRGERAPDPLPQKQKVDQMPAGGHQAQPPDPEPDVIFLEGEDVE